MSAGDEQQRRAGEQPRDQAFRDRADVADPPAAAVGRVLRDLGDVAGDRVHVVVVEAGARRSAASGTARRGSPRRSARGRVGQRRGDEPGGDPALADDLMAARAAVGEQPAAFARGRRAAGSTAGTAGPPGAARPDVGDRARRSARSVEGGLGTLGLDARAGPAASGRSRGRSRRPPSPAPRSVGPRPRYALAASARGRTRTTARTAPAPRCGGPASRGGRAGGLRADHRRSRHRPDTELPDEARRARDALLIRSLPPLSPRALPDGRAALLGATERAMRTPSSSGQHDAPCPPST